MSEPTQFASDADAMRYAVELAQRGIGRVEPNPAVGAVLIDEQRRLVAVGWHQQFGEAHAEINAFRDFERRHSDPIARAELLRSATLLVTLEPCCHHGKTPPCSESVVASGVRRVVVGLRDPSPHVDGGGLRQLEAAGLDVSSGLLEDEVRQLNAPFLMLVQNGRPWVHAKWAMTLDGRIATRTGSSKWISCEASRAIVHELRGRMDAVIVGSGTVHADDPLLTARPPGPRTPVRIVVDSRAELSLDSQLVHTAGDVPVMIATLDSVPAERTEALTAAGVEVLRLPASPALAEAADDCFTAAHVDLAGLLRELGQRVMTNVLVEGGGGLLGSLFDRQFVDEAHVFLAPKFCGGVNAVSPVGGLGVETIPQQSQLDPCVVTQVGQDVYLRGHVRRAL
ncbi:bifunctional diaminohydroxyphosphoribosylaminopyrimidine deaminase/5-amino-6-(5-phosphoribosylamino)uracil reductase RibD [bacterium]|nr:bifunctional diaminohydroxyphosphoribosylaminopyrimidine deaminase/5-amino-6-(5-phosphoribosylamino)uracil reductase RibD [bacterium]